MIFSIIVFATRTMLKARSQVVPVQVWQAIICVILAIIIHTLRTAEVQVITSSEPGYALAKHMDACNCLLFGWLSFREIASMYLVPLRSFRARFMMVAVLAFNSFYSGSTLYYEEVGVLCLTSDTDPNFNWMRCVLPHRILVHWVFGNSGFIIMQALYLDDDPSAYPRLVRALAFNLIMLYFGYVWLSTANIFIRNMSLLLATIGLFMILRFQTLLHTSVASEIPDIQKLLALHVVLSWTLYPIVALLSDWSIIGYWTGHALFAMLEMPSKAWFVELVYQGHLKLLDHRATVRHKKLQSWMAAQYQFFMSATHELRNPLHACIGLAELLENQIAEDNRVTAVTNSAESWSKSEVVVQLQDVLSHMSRTVNDLLDLGSMETGIDFKLNDSAFTLREMVEDAILITQYRQTSVGGKVVYTLASDADEVVYTDKHRLRQILINLLDNGLKFTPQGATVEIRAELQLLEQHESGDGTMREAKRAVHVAVRDQGVGLSSEQVDQLFKPFTQLHTDQVVGGTGLGLNLCNRLVSSMGGRLTVSSEGIGHGAEFDILIPVRAQPKADDTAESETPSNITSVSPVSSSSPSLTRRSLKPLNISPNLEIGDVRCLVVDDNRINVRLLVRQLLKLGMKKNNILTALSGAEAFSTFEQNRLDVVFLDLHLGDMLGDALRTQLRAFEKAQGWPLCHMIAYTAANLPRDKHAEYDYVILKPATFDDLNRWWTYCHQETRIQ